MSDDATYDLLCKVSMGVPLAPDDRAALKAERLIEEKTLVTPNGQALMKRVDAAKMTPVVVNEHEIDALLRTYPDLGCGFLVLSSRQELMALSGYRAKYLIEIGTVATVYEWGDSPHERKMEPRWVARLSKWARNFLSARDEERRAAATRKAIAARLAALPALPPEVA